MLPNVPKLPPKTPKTLHNPETPQIPQISDLADLLNKGGVFDPKSQISPKIGGFFSRFTLRNRDLGSPKPDFFAACGGQKTAFYP